MSVHLLVCQLVYKSLERADLIIERVDKRLDSADLKLGRAELRYERAELRYDKAEWRFEKAELRTKKADQRRGDEQIEGTRCPRTMWSVILYRQRSLRGQTPVEHSGLSLVHPSFHPFVCILVTPIKNLAS